MSKKSDFNSAQDHTNKIINSFIAYLEEIKSLINKIDKKIERAATFLEKYQANEYKSATNIFLLKNENGYWKFFKNILHQNKFTITQSNKGFYYTHKRIEPSKIGHYFKNFDCLEPVQTKNKRREEVRAEIKDLILITSELILQRNKLLSKIANAGSGIKRIKFNESLIEKLDLEILNLK